MYILLLNFEMLKEYSSVLQKYMFIEWYKNICLLSGTRMI